LASENVRGAPAWAPMAKNNNSKATQRTLIESIFLRHNPENLHTAIVAVGEGNVVVFVNFFE